MEGIYDLLKEAVNKTVRNEEFKYVRAANLLSSEERAAPVLTKSGTHVGERVVSSGWPFENVVDAIAGDVHVVRVTREDADAVIDLSCVVDTTSGDVVFGKRISIVVEEGAKAQVIERHGVDGSGVGLSFTETEIVAHAGSNVEHIKIIDSVGVLKHVGRTHVDVHRDATFTSHVHCLNAAWVRNDLMVRLVESGANAYLYGVSVLNGEEFADNHTAVDHMMPHCHSEELYKGVYDGQSIGVFNGKIFVRPQAQKTTAYQSCKSVLVSPRATVNAKPQLEIWADDVKCSHGATTGALSEESLFYLRSRGLSYDDARALLTYAHAAEVVDHISDDALRISLEQRLAEKLGMASW